MRKKIKVVVLSSAIFILFLATFFCLNIPFKEINLLSSDMIISFEDLESLNQKKPFGKFVNLSFDNEILVSNSETLNTNLNVKFLNLITIKKVPVKVEKLSVYSGGRVVGFSLNSNGVIIIGNSSVATENGNINPVENKDVKVGDILLEINGEKVNRISDLTSIVNSEENKNKELTLKLKRDDEIIERKITPVQDKLTKTYKLGIWVKDDASGVGTLTYVRKDNLRFGALGHAISDSDTKKPFELNSGDMYDCTVIGLNKGKKGTPGEVKALFIQGKNTIGTVDKNIKYGVFGTYNSDKVSKLNEDSLIEVGGRLSAKPGKAKVRVSLDNDEIKDYDIEIIKTNYQNMSSEKSMVIRVTDKELLEKTGGIIQGMSGSPIIQNGKIIGAITHVFISDPTKGFGVYLDWMINE